MERWVHLTVLTPLGGDMAGKYLMMVSRKWRVESILKRVQSSPQSDSDGKAHIGVFPRSFVELGEGINPRGLHDAITTLWANPIPLDA